ncbi:hypothetical protein [Halovulum sp. GXIMD14793]
MKFERPDGSIGQSPGTGTALFAMGDIAISALKQCDLGIVTPQAIPPTRKKESRDA